MRMGKKNKLHLQFAPARKADHFAGIGPGIKSCCHSARGIPYQIRVDGHIVVMRVELHKAVLRINFFWMPFASGKFRKCSRRETEDWSDTQKSQFIDIALAQLTDFLRTDTRFLRQFGIGNAQAALGFSNDVTDVVFERYHLSIS